MAQTNGAGEGTGGEGASETDSSSVGGTPEESEAARTSRSPAGVPAPGAKETSVTKDAPTAMEVPALKEAPAAMGGQSWDPLGEEDAARGAARPEGELTTHDALALLSRWREGREASDPARVRSFLGHRKEWVVLSAMVVGLEKGHFDVAECRRLLAPRPVPLRRAVTSRYLVRLSASPLAADVRACALLKE